MAFPRISLRWLLGWIALLAVVVVACVTLVRNLGLPWLGLAGPLVGFVGSVPAWIGRVVPAEAQIATTPRNGGKAADQLATGTSDGPRFNNSEPVGLGSPPVSVPRHPQSSLQEPLSGDESPVMAETERRRYPGSRQYSDLVYALGRALGNPASVYQVSELAGLNRGDLEDGFVNAPTRWHAALKLAVESGLEEALCHEALRASPNRELHKAAAAYLS